MYFVNFANCLENFSDNELKGGFSAERSWAPLTEPVPMLDECRTPINDAEVVAFFVFLHAQGAMGLVIAHSPHLAIRASCSKV